MLYSMSDGWIKIHRKMTEWEWYNHSEMVHLFIHLILKATPTEKVWQGITLKRGQAVIGRQKLSAETGISEMTTRTCLNRLKESGEIEIQSSNRFSIITICNYDSYQQTEPQAIQPTIQQPNQPTNQPTNHPTNHPANHNIRNKEDDSFSTPTPPNGVAGVGVDEKKKSSSKRKKPEEFTIVHKGRLIFEEFFKKLFDENYIWSATDAASMKKLLDKLKSGRKVKGLSVDDDSVLSALPVFLDTISDKWVMEHLSVSVIASKYNELVAQAKAAKTNSNYGQQNRTNNADKRRSSEVTATKAEDYEGAF